AATSAGSKRRNSIDVWVMDGCSDVGPAQAELEVSAGRVHGSQKAETIPKIEGANDLPRLITTFTAATRDSRRLTPRAAPATSTLKGPAPCVIWMFNKWGS